MRIYLYSYIRPIFIPMIIAIKTITLLLIIFSCIYLYPYLNPHDIDAHIQRNQTIAPCIFILVTALRPILFFLPSMGLTIMAGVLFGMVWGTVYVAIGGAISTIVGFYFARWLGRDAIKWLVKNNNLLMEIEKRSKEYGGRAVLYMRLFNVPWDMVSYWAGLSGINFKDFYVASMIPLVPVSFLYTYFGSQMFTPKSAGFIISLTIMILMGSIPSIRARYKKKLHG